MKSPLSYVPALPAAIGMMAGIVIFYRLSDSLFVAAAIAAAALIIFVLRRHWIGFVLFFALMGFALSSADRPIPPPETLLQEKAVWQGEIFNIKSSPAATRIYLTVDSSSGLRSFHPFDCALLVPNLPYEYLPGDKVCFEAIIKSIESSTPDLPDEISYNPTFFVDGITASAYVSPDDITLLSSRPNLRRTAMSMRADIVDYIYRSPVSSSTAWFLAATLVGDDSMVDRSTIDNFRSVGAAHYLALSGFHVGIIALIASLLFFPLRGFSRFGRLRHLGVIALIWLYAFVCGLSPSLVRAALLISIFLLAKILQRPSSPYNSLCVAAIIILIFSPRQLFALGFQLSFTAVLSILVFAQKLNPFARSHRIAYRIAELFTVPISAMIGTCLISIIYFHRFPLLFLIPNIALAALLPLLLGGGVILVIFTAIGLRFTLLGNVLDHIYSAIERLCAFLSGLPGSEITGIFISPTVITVCIGALIFLAFALWRHKMVYAIFAAALAFIAVSIHLLQPSLPESELFITRTPLHTDIIARDGSSALLISSATGSTIADTERRLRIRYADYLARRECPDSLSIMTGDFTMPHIARRGPYLIYKDRTVYLGFSPDLSEAKDFRVDYLLVTRSAGSQPFRLVKALRPDTVIIARDMPPLRATRIADSCTAAAIPYIRLTDTSFTLN